MSDEADPLAEQRKPDRPVVIALALLLAAFLGLVIHNVDQHPAHIGYDAWEHMAYTATLAEGRLPREADTHEFFSPPLPYVAAATLAAIKGSNDGIGKIMKGQNVPLAILAFGLLIVLLRQLGVSGWASVWAMGCFTLLPVVHKSFAMARGEPMVMTLCLACLTAGVAMGRSPRSWTTWIAFGVLIGLTMISRQWALFAATPAALVPAGRAIWRRRSDWPRVMTSALTATVVAAPFYIWLWVAFGSPIAFNRAPVKNSHSMASLLLPSPPPRALWTDPRMHEMAGHLWPILYADVWGDYWLEWKVFGKNERGTKHKGRHARPENLGLDGIIETNHARQRPALVRSVFLGLLPTAVVALGAGWTLVWLIRTRGRASEALPAMLCVMTLLLTWLGYGYFVVRHADGTGDVVKGTYVLHVMPMLIALAAMMLSRQWSIGGRVRRSMIVAVAALTVLCLLGNASMLTTSYG